MSEALLQFASELCRLIEKNFRGANFDLLARNLFALQFAANEPYRKFCQARNLSPESLPDWSCIPAISAGAFKEMELTSLAVDNRSHIFFSSGTTGQKRGLNFHNRDSLRVYETSLWQWFHRNFDLSLDIPFGFLSLTPGIGAAPNSSLVYMFDTIRRKRELPGSVFTGELDGEGAWQLNLPATLKQMSRGIEHGKPLLFCGTAFSFVHLVDHLSESHQHLRLPPGSRIMETGGYKNRSRVLPKHELYGLISEYLGVPSNGIISEYGMSELSSQAYTIASAEGATPDHSVLRFPPWARVQIISPETGLPVENGETGLIQICDLANVFSVAAIQTEDLGVRRGDDFELVGRVPRAEPRGCSLLAS